MATPTLEEIEAGLRTVGGAFSEALLGLVAHVRALQEQLGGVDAMMESHSFGLQSAHARGHANATAIEALEAWQLPDRVSAVERSAEGLEGATTALEEKLMLERAALDKTNERIGIEELARRQEIDIHGERIAALEAKVATMGQDDGSATYAGQLRRLLLSANGENHRLRAENAELRKRIAELEEWWRCNLCFGSGFYVANSGAGKVECPYCGPSVSREKPTAAKPWPAPKWPAAQPIETAPLGRIMVWVEGERALPDQGYWSYLVSTRSDTLETWRAALRDWGHRWWAPEPPPPPGGAK